MEEYFARPFSLHQGWSAVDSSKELYKFWKQCWGSNRPSEFLTHADLAPKYMSIEDISSTAPESVQLFPTSILNSPPGRSLIRAEYTSLYDWLSNYHNDSVFSRRRQAAIITGHPGIGKSVFRVFILYQRCLAKKPTLFYDTAGRKLYLFYQDGVAMHKANDDLDLGQFTRETWLLMDALDELTIPSLLWEGEEKQPRIILTASPTSCTKWSTTWVENQPVDVVKVFMKGWTDDELRYGCALYKIPWSDLRKRRRGVGAVPRNLFRDNHEQLATMSEAAVYSLSNNEIEHLLTSSYPNLPHEIIYDNRTNPDPRTLPAKFILSSRVAGALRTRLLQMDRSKRLSLFSRLYGVLVKELTNVLYEIYVLDRLAEDVVTDLELFPCPEDSKTIVEGKNHDADLGPNHNELLQSPTATTFRIVGVSAYDLHRKSRIAIQPEILYVPLSIDVGKTGHVAFYLDSFGPSNVLRLLRITTTVEPETLPEMVIRDMKERIMGLPPEEDWEMIYIRPYKVEPASVPCARFGKVSCMCCYFPADFVVL
ncbi:hypothetical protein VNI00_002366 [Paramarasmius palmivorus]|uniref:Uncharacterized protein n=1 Tax=Paramarasmius palmivorus TaxID=297713 RepID=A0AAW0DV60_9AGAR